MSYSVKRGASLDLTLTKPIATGERPKIYSPESRLPIGVVSDLDLAI
jgi:hypothetical protein